MSVERALIEVADVCHFNEGRTRHSLTGHGKTRSFLTTLLAGSVALLERVSLAPGLCLVLSCSGTPPPSPDRPPPKTQNNRGNDRTGVLPAFV